MVPPSLADDSIVSVASPPLDAATAVPSIFSQFSLASQVAVVTGGAQGLGYAMAASLCSAGLAGIAILDLNPLVGGQAAMSLQKLYGTRARFYTADVTDELVMKSVFAEINDDFGGIDVVVCSAGIVENYPAEEYPFSRFQRVLNINLSGSFLSAQAAFPYLRARGGGSIIFIGSMSGHIVNFPQCQIAYNASKAGVIHMMKTFAAEWAKYKIRCNSISPGYMRTELVSSFDPNMVQHWIKSTPMGRMGLPDELQGVALWLASKASSFTTGADISVDGGYTTL
ncbi:hypothetical protein POJ06DRAFT_67401 [Lipomyces tetrasporus]|uniref:Uncharacterized protein n=1 Tax=Lipomyces tetrasporus TaxID=54092 RepID=A0AAD7R0I1_9ASCO|nr:uncharacterized protein POJ06DRAFT_67401 [Lipomyces tetrasporus]KAJ8103337.1 hypothetical protein POJ06DRAFT_67401 [Lipomyces tetrasporus]